MFCTLETQPQNVLSEATKESERRHFTDEVINQTIIYLSKILSLEMEKGLLDAASSTMNIVVKYLGAINLAIVLFTLDS